MTVPAFASRHLQPHAAHQEPASTLPLRLQINRRFSAPFVFIGAQIAGNGSGSVVPGLLAGTPFPVASARPVRAVRMPERATAAFDDDVHSERSVDLDRGKRNNPLRHLYV